MLALKPEILVLDESTAMLDPKGRKEVLEVIKKLNKDNGVTVITVTHYMDEVVDADKVYVINDGKIALCGTPSEIFKQKELIKSLGLELPLCAEIRDKLAERGIILPYGILTKERLAEELCALKRKS